MDDATLAAGRVAAGAVVDLGLAVVAGALATRGLLGASVSTSAWAARRVEVAWRALGVAAGLALVASLARSWLLAITMSDLDPVAALGEWPGVVTGTQAGRTWIVEAGALVLALAGAVVATRRSRTSGTSRLGTAIAAVALLALAGARARAGHAGAQGALAPWLLMAAHLLAIGAWGGAVVVGAVVVRRDAALVDAADRRAAARWLAGLSTLATAALALVVATGVALAWRALGGELRALVPDASAAAWALALDAKLAFVALAVGLGAFNRFTALRPAISALVDDAACASPSMHRFLRVLRIEALAMAVVLVLAAVLATQEPPSA